MSSLRGLLHRKSKSQDSDTEQKNNPYGQSEKRQNEPRKGNTRQPVPAIQIMRSTTYSQELLTAPSFSPAPTEKPERTPSSGSSVPQRANTVKETGKRLSNLLHLNRRSRASSVADIYSHPSPKGKDIPPWPSRSDNAATKSEEERQAQWEQRATLLVEGTTEPVSLPPSPGLVTESSRMSFNLPNNTRNQETPDWPLRSPTSPARNKSLDGTADTKSVEEKSDDDIQAAITLHESGDLETSTAMFGRLADPAGADNALAQVLYGLALRHGWGISPDPNLAIQYLTYSARNSSNLTSSLSKTQGKSPLKRGELTLAIYELGNCHRNGWGVAKSLPLAMQYFETAAELGDADAMIEVAMAWEKGIKGWQSGKKDRGMAAKWYRRAERAGRKEVGNSWIWKEKYDEFDEGRSQER